MSPLIPNQRRFRTGDDVSQSLLSAPGMNKPIDAVIALADDVGNLSLPGFPLSILREVWVGAVVEAPTNPDSTPADPLTDQNYYVRRQQLAAFIDTGLTGYGDDNPREPEISDEPTPGQQQTVVAANLAEYSTGTHSLAEDGSVFVTVFGFDAGDGTGRRLYVFNVGGSSLVLLKISGSLTIDGGTPLAGAMYSARAWGPLTGGTLSLATMTGGTLSAAALGTDPGANNAYVINEAELGKTTHDLLSSSNSATLINGLFLATAEDGYPIYTGVLVFPGCDA